MTQSLFDQYIERAQPFARPILRHIRQLVHEACPEVKETIKWGVPHFDYKGMMCGMAAFKEHCVLSFWKGSLMADEEGVMDKTRSESMGQFGRLTSLDDLPSDDIVIAYVKEAMALNDAGVNIARKPNVKKELVVAEDFKEALDASEAAALTFEKFPYSKKKDYIEWIEEAKQEATRVKRIAQAIEWLNEGKSRNWKYECK